jgi:lipoprotein-releasing system permease protein
MGLKPSDHIRATGFAKTLHYHALDPENVFVPSYNPGLAGCIVGIDLMPSSRDRSGEYYHSPNSPRYELIISCFPLTPKGGLAKAGTDLVNTLSFFYSDDSHSGLVKVDGRVIYIPLDYAQKMCGMSGETPRISAVHVKFTDDTALDEGCRKIKQMWRTFVEANKDRQYASLLENVSVQSWVDNRRSVIAPMEKEQTMLTLLFGMLGIITVFVIFVVFYMIISHKSKDIGILRSIGVSGWGVVELFTYFAVIAGVVGAGIGAAAGCGVLVRANEIEDWLFARFGFQVWDRSIYAIGDIPNKIELHVLAVIMLAAVAASVVGALVPAIQAARKRPAEALQVNQL